MVQMGVDGGDPWYCFPIDFKCSLAHSFGDMCQAPGVQRGTGYPALNRPLLLITFQCVSL